MSNLTAKQIKSLAMSINTAKKYGIITQVSSTGPSVLLQAEKILAGLIKRADNSIPSAPSMRYEGIYYRNVEMAQAYANAVQELRDAINS